MHKPLEAIKPRPLIELVEHLQGLIKGRLWLKIVIGMFLGISVGLLLGPSAGLVTKSTAYVIGNWLAFPGRLFLILIQMIVIPLILASVIIGIGTSEDIRKLKKLGLRAGAYYIITTLVAITIGILLALTIQPGKYIDSELVQETIKNPNPIEVENKASNIDLSDIPESIISIFPENPLSAMVSNQMLQIVIFAIIFGVALVSIEKSHSRPLIQILRSLQEVCMTIVKWAMRLAPIAVFGLLAQITSRIGIDVIVGLGIYVGSVILGLLLLLCFYLIIVLVISKRSPWDFMNRIREVQLLAFSTSSSAAVMPLTLNVADEKLNINPSIARFLIPLGATVNMDGTALYQGVATIFLSQVFGIDLGLNALILIIITAVGASIGTPSTPGVGIIVLATILNSAGIPVGGIALIIGVDRILDMCRTSINVTSDLTACIVIDKWLGGNMVSNHKIAQGT